MGGSPSATLCWSWAPSPLSCQALTIAGAVGDQVLRDEVVDQASPLRPAGHLAAFIDGKDAVDKRGRSRRADHQQVHDHDGARRKKNPVRKRALITLRSRTRAHRSPRSRRPRRARFCSYPSTAPALDPRVMIARELRVGPELRLACRAIAGPSTPRDAKAILGRPRPRDRKRGKGIAGARPSVRSLSGNAIVARVARLGAGAPLSSGDCDSAPGVLGGRFRASTITCCVGTAVPRDRCDLDHSVVAWPGVAVIPSLPAHALFPIVPSARELAVPGSGWLHMRRRGQATGRPVITVVSLALAKRSRHHSSSPQHGHSNA